MLYKDENGDLVVNEEKAENVKLIFELYLSGNSGVGIIEEFHNRNIKSPTGKNSWPKGTIEKILCNEKYIGTAVVNIGGEDGQIYKMSNAHPEIISKETFEAVHKEKNSEVMLN